MNKKIIKAQNVTNPNTPNITLWKLKHGNGKITVFRGSWQSLYKRYNGGVEEIE